MISPSQMKSAIQKLGERGIHLPADSDRQDVVGAIAMVMDLKQIPHGSAYDEVIWRFIRQGATPAPTRDFKPYTPGKEWDAVNERINPNKQFKHSAGRFWNK